MEFDWLGRARPWVLGALLTLLLTGACRVAFVVHEKGIRDTCKDCKGSGTQSFVMLVCPGNPSTTIGPCGGCGGKGFFWTFDDRFLKAGPSFFADLSLVVIAAVFLGLIAGLKAGVCPRCEGEGELEVEFHPPHRAAFRRVRPCTACEGKGAVTHIDRWLAGF